MVAKTVIVGVLAQKKKLANPWVDHEWRPYAVLDGVPAAAPRTRVGVEGEDELWYLGPGEALLHPAETAHYHDNLVAARPSVWVALRPDGQGGWAVAGVTVDPYEGEAFCEVVDDRVEALDMPPGLRAVLGAFVAEHHVETPFFKRKRDRKSGRDPDDFGVGHPERDPSRGPRRTP